MEQRDLISELMVNRDYFSTVERKIADVILKDPKKFIQIDESLQALSIDTFNSKVINTSKMTSFEVVQYIREHCHAEMQR